MGMTWKLKVARVAFALLVVAGLSMAAGADWVFCAFFRFF
jgi:hypothetical protein